MTPDEAYGKGWNDGYADGYTMGYNAAMMSASPAQFSPHGGGPTRTTLPHLGVHGMSFEPLEAPKKKRKASAYNKRLGKAIKDLTKRHKLKSGKWRKGWNQKRMMKAAHKAAKR